METSDRLCEDCSKLSLDALLESIPKPRHPRGRGGGVPNFYEYNIPEPLSLGLAARETCSLCELIQSREASASALSSTSKTRPLLLAALCPPTQFCHRTTHIKDVGCIFNQFGEAQPQWHGFIDDTKRVNKIEPITHREGSTIKSQNYRVDSPWQVHVAAEEGRTCDAYANICTINHCRDCCRKVYNTTTYRKTRLISFD